jgi:hypothetical protein
MKDLDIGKLNQMYQDAKSHLTRHFAELRSNILLDAGYHHNRRLRWRDARPQSNGNDKKVKITKNHIQVITRHIENNILNANPGCGVFPRHDRELSNQKAAELNQSVWNAQKEKLDEPQKRKELCHDFIVCGEVFLKVAWDKMAGTFRGYETDVIELDPDNEDLDIPLPLSNPAPIYDGALVWERVYPFDVLTDPYARSYDGCRYVMIRKLIPMESLKAIYAFDDKKLSYIQQASQDDTYQIFDGLTGQYTEAKDHTLVKECYVRPCPEYPKGYYFYFTKEGILEEGELPSDNTGAPLPFPVRHCGYDQSNTSVRSFSVIKQIKPMQLEVNRAASAIVMESLVLGHSTVLTQAGSKLSSAGLGNGMKKLVYTGTKPDIQRGTNGDQYMSYVDSQTREMYELAGVPYREQDKAPIGNDTMSLLFRSLKDKKRFSYYAEKFARFMVGSVDLSLSLCKLYMSEDEIIPMIGKNEAANIAEFKNTNPLHSEVKIEERTDDFVGMMGKSLQISQLLQYAGNTLSSADVGIMARNLPFLNKEELIQDSVLDYDLSVNTILALDRGEQPPMTDGEDHAYMIKRLTNRMKKPDYALLNQEIKDRYQQRVDMHQQFLISQKQEAEMATAGFVPTSGGLVPCQVYAPDENGENKRLYLPNDALQWLNQKIQAQGYVAQQIEGLPLQSQAEMGSQEVTQLPAR